MGPKVHERTLKKGYPAAWPTVVGIIRTNGHLAKRKRKFMITTDTNYDYQIAPDILERDFR
ncbi:hypothetical protein ACNR9Q_12405 [Maribacter sp. X9]|uniref:hypothetical protein n=1 Tax=Maribacter sp. X9 TaxID=3402159 RepID=UPI003AF37FFE